MGLELSGISKEILICTKKYLDTNISECHLH